MVKIRKIGETSRSNYRLWRRLQSIQKSHHIIDIGYPWKRLTFLGIIDIYIKGVFKLSGNPPNVRGPLFETQVEAPPIKGSEGPSLVNKNGKPLP